MARRSPAATALLAAALATLLVATATTATATTTDTELAAPALPDLDDIDPPTHDLDAAIVESAQVTTRTGTPTGTGTGAPTDTRIWVDIIRPDTDDPVPTILIASPYFNTLGRGWRGQGKLPTDETLSFPYLGAVGAPAERVPFPEWYDEYFVPRGYAVALMDLRGTRNSSGCQVYGDRDEVFDAVDVIDWIAEQGWSNGKVGMTGGSYDGTIAIGAAAEAPLSAEHPDALAAIIPIRAIDRWYDYHFFNGVQSSGHALTPALFTAVLAAQDQSTAGTEDVLLPLHLAERLACIPTIGAAVDAGYASPYQDADSAFWAERDFVADAAQMRAAVFAISGLFDFNVKNHNVGYLWESLPEELPRKLWLMNADHADPHLPSAEAAAEGGHVMPFPFPDRFVEWTHRWYAQFLKGLDAGAMDAPTVEAQRRDGDWDAVAAYPASADLELAPTADGRLVAPDEGDESGAVAWADGPLSAEAGDAVFVTEPLAAPLQLSGQVAFDLGLTIDGPDTTVGATVLSVPPGVEPTAPDTITHDGDADAEAPLTVTYGWARAWYRDTIPLRGVSTPSGGGPTTPGAPFRLTFGASHTDVVIPAGHRLAVVFANSAGGTIAAETGGTVTLDTATSRILLPIPATARPEPPLPPGAGEEPGRPGEPAGPTPATGGGSALAGLVALGAGLLARRRRSAP